MGLGIYNPLSKISAEKYACGAFALMAGTFSCTAGALANGMEGFFTGLGITAYNTALIGSVHSKNTEKSIISDDARFSLLTTANLALVLSALPGANSDISFKTLLCIGATSPLIAAAQSWTIKKVVDFAYKGSFFTKER